jgi:hypothetical protein
VMLQFVQRLGFDLADALARDFEDSARFFQGVSQGQRALWGTLALWA